MSDVLRALQNADNIVLAGHANPDGDSIGACFGLGLALKAAGKNPVVVIEKYNSRFDCIPGGELVFTGDPAELVPDTFVMLDCNSPERLGTSKAVLACEGITTVCIDHHVSYSDFAQINLKDPAASSTCEMVYHLAKEAFPINPDAAAALYAGIVYDTGGFRHSSCGSNTLRAVAELMDLGAPHTYLYNTIMHSRELSEAKAVSVALSRMEILDGGIAFTYITEEDLEATGAVSSQLGSVCDYGVNINGVKVSVFIYPKGVGMKKISLRSKELHVNQVVEDMGGGGHQLACGCNFIGTIDEAREAVISRLNKIIWN